MLIVNEIFYSVQGEGTSVGTPTVFVRLTGCNLRCVYCDTEYAFYEGEKMTLDETIAEVEKYECKTVEITGGEPLLQKESLELMKRLADKGFDVLLETSGSVSIAKVDKRVKIIMDLKTPSSEMADKNLYENIEFLDKKDEVKFVVGSAEDYEWAKKKIEEYALEEKTNVVFSPVFGVIEPREIVERILRDKLKARFLLQMHKYIWEHDRRGV
jgi:7-carboxy-7-deazaguanine synthase